jgi:branched-chain amino acid transport system substrate-binding protein
MKKILSLVLTVVFLIVALVTLAGCGQTGAGNTAAEVKIGEFGPLTGDAATDGTQARDGATLAVEQINAAGGVLGSKLSLVAMDDEASAPEAMTVVQKLLDQEKVVALLSGSYSTPTKTVAPVVQAAKTPMVVEYATNADITKGGNYIFRTIYSGTTQGAAVADYAIQDKGYKKFAVLYTNNDYGVENGQAFSDEVTKLGGEVVISRNYVDGTKDFNAILTAVKDKSPDAIYVGSYYNEAAQICSQAKQLGLTAQVLGDDGFDSPKLVELAGTAAEGVVFSSPFSRDDPRKLVQDFISSYTTRFSKDPDMLSAQAFDSAMVLADAMKRANSVTDKDAIRQALSETKDFAGVTGAISFNAANEVIKPVILMTVTNGKFVFLKNQTIGK